MVTIRMGPNDLSGEYPYGIGLQSGGKIVLSCYVNSTYGMVRYLIDWQLLGVAAQIEANEFHFEDAKIENRRFYRLVTP